MRFHHSTRRGRNRLGHHSQRQASQRLGHHSSQSSRWSQLGYCRETNIHFNRRLPVEPPAGCCGAVAAVDEMGAEARKIAFAGQSAESSVEYQPLDIVATINGSRKLELEGGEQQIDEQLRRLSLGEANSDSNNNDNSHDLAMIKRTSAASSRHHSSRHKSRELSTVVAGIEAASAQQTNGKIDMESARQKLVAQVEKHPFWSNKAARRMQLTSVEERQIYIYELVSYCERRDLEWRYESYRGGLVSSVPFRRVDTSTAAGFTMFASTSQPGTPTGAGPERYTAGAVGTAASTDLMMFSPGGRAAIVQQQQQRGSRTSTLTVPRPATASPTLSASQDAPGAGSPTTSATTTPPATSGAGRRHHHHARSPIRRSCSTAAPPAATSLYEPVSAIERPVPSAEYVWSLSPPAHVRPEPFSGYAHSTEVPGSSFVKRCHGCQGRGRLKCSSCHGVGYEVCISCSGRGTTKSLSSALGASSCSSASRSLGKGADNPRNSTSASGHSDGGGGHSASDGRGSGGGGGLSGGSHSVLGSGSAWVTESCHYCHGAGQKRCWVCAGKSYNHCLGCMGTGQLRCYLNLSITWMNHRDESVLNNSDNIIPKERLRLCSGLLLADMVGECLLPLGPTEGATGGGRGGGGRRRDETGQLHLASKRLLEKHADTFCRQERLIKQRQKVTQIECYVVKYEWKKRRGHFVIYGDERKVYIAKYPFKSFCNIT